MNKVLLLIVGIMVYHFTTTSSFVAENVLHGMQDITGNTIANGKLVEDMMSGNTSTFSMESMTRGYGSDSDIGQVSGGVLKTMFDAHDAIRPILDGISDAMDAVTPSTTDTSDL